MGVLVPEDFPLGKLANDEERSVVDAFVDGLSDGWYVIPDVGVLDRRDHQIDIVLVHPKNGVFVVEVKGHRPQIRNGQWVTDRGPMSPQPVQQARDNTYKLRDLLRGVSSELEHLNIDYAIAFPNAGEIRGSLPAEITRDHLILSPDFDDVDDAIDRLVCARWRSEFSDQATELIIRTLRPDADFDMDPAARQRRARSRLETICANQVRALERLDMNRRVVVTGGSGTGKTRLAMAWARRSVVNDRRTLLTCYNDPLGDMMRERMPEHDALRVGPFLRLTLTLEGMPHIDIPPTADNEWWSKDLVGHLISNWHRITERFDTVVIDEAQDFSPAWLALLEQLLDRDGSQRILMVADVEQELFNRGFTLPSELDGWTRCELVNNCRNTFDIARLLRNRLGGPAAPAGGPESAGIQWIPANTTDTAVSETRAEVDRLISLGVPAESILVTTVSQATRDALTSGAGFVRWEDRGEGSVVCETVRRAKGLEYDHVLLVVPTEAFDRRLAYVGVGRAISAFTLVGNAAFASELGLN
jgi:hypothetical protein